MLNIDTDNILYLSKRNLLTLLSKLERFEKGEMTECTIIKRKNNLDPYCMRIGCEDVKIIAIPDSKYYTARSPGAVLDKDDPDLKGNYENSSK